MLQHELIVCSSSHGKGKASKNKSSRTSSDPEMAATLNSRAENDDGEDDDEEDRLELTEGENWLRLRIINTSSVLQTQDDEDLDELSLAKLSQRTTQDPPGFRRESSMTSNTTPHPFHYATILSIRNMGFNAVSAMAPGANQDVMETDGNLMGSSANTSVSMLAGCYICLDVMVNAACRKIDKEDQKGTDTREGSDSGTTAETFLTIKDTRFPSKDIDDYCRKGIWNPQKFSNSTARSNNGDNSYTTPSTPSCVGICRRNNKSQNMADGWFCLPRKVLTPLYPGDLICTDLQHSSVYERMESTDTDTVNSANSNTIKVTVGGIVLEYRPRHVTPNASMSQSQTQQQIAMSQLSMSQLSQTQDYDECTLTQHSCIHRQQQHTEAMSTVHASFGTQDERPISSKGNAVAKYIVSLKHPPDTTNILEREEKRSQDAIKRGNDDDESVVSSGDSDQTVPMTQMPLMVEPTNAKSPFDVAVGVPDKVCTPEVKNKLEAVLEAEVEEGYLASSKDGGGENAPISCAEHDFLSTQPNEDHDADVATNERSPGEAKVRNDDDDDATEFGGEIDTFNFPKTQKKVAVNPTTSDPSFSNNPSSSPQKLWTQPSQEVNEKKIQPGVKREENDGSLPPSPKLQTHFIDNKRSNQNSTDTVSVSKVVCLQSVTDLKKNLLDGETSRSSEPSSDLGEHESKGNETSDAERGNVAESRSAVQNIQRDTTKLAGGINSEKRNKAGRRSVGEKEMIIRGATTKPLESDSAYQETAGGNERPSSDVMGHSAHFAGSKSVQLGPYVANETIDTGMAIQLTNMPKFPSSGCKGGGEETKCIDEEDVTDPEDEESEGRVERATIGDGVEEMKAVAGARQEPVEVKKRKANDEHTPPTRKSRRIKAPSRRNVASSESIIASAQERYAGVFHQAIVDGTVKIAVSNLSTSEAATVEYLISKKTFQNGIKLKLSEDVDADTTLCVVTPETGKGGDIKATIRSKKVMRAALLGIPIATPDWLQFCKKRGVLILPESFVQTLPTKSEAIEQNDESKYGVAKLAAEWKLHPESPQLPFSKSFVYLCGSFKMPRKDLTDLLEDGAAAMLLTPIAASSRIKDLMDDSVKGSMEQSIVIVCGDSRVSLTKSLEKDIKTAANSGAIDIKVVGWQWVLESITCGKAMPVSLFQPVAKKDLWKLCLREDASS